MDRTKTRMGMHELKSRLCAPLLHLPSINHRLDLLSYFHIRPRECESPTFDEISICDISRICSIKASSIKTIRIIVCIQYIEYTFAGKEINAVLNDISDIPRLLQSITRTDSDTVQPTLLYDMQRALANLHLVWYGMEWLGIYCIILNN